METLSRAEARRVAIAAQGFTGKTRGASAPRPGRRRLLGLVDDLGLLQLDSVSALVRSHYLPAYSRLGPYDRALLDGLAWGGPATQRPLFEAWAHQASLLPVHFEPQLRWRQAVVAADAMTSGQSFHSSQQRPDLIEAVLAEIRAGGPLAASELSHLHERPKSPGGWWNWSEVKEVCEFLFATGRLHVADRRGFERRYDVPERVLPADVLARPTPDEADARRTLLLHAAEALGVATATDLADYFRMKNKIASARIGELVDDGSLVEVDVEGWAAAAYVRPDVIVPSRVRARALLSPFDPLVWSRPRNERLLDFHYRIEIYTPEPKRTYGYYVLPFLLGDRIVARVDLRADRGASVLRVPGAFAEPGVRAADVAGVAASLAVELRLLAHWLELDTFDIGDRGELIGPLAEALAESVPMELSS